MDCLFRSTLDMINFSRDLRPVGSWDLVILRQQCGFSLHQDLRFGRVSKINLIIFVDSTAGGGVNT